MRQEGDDEAPNDDDICNEIMSIRGKDDANNDLLQFCEEEVMSCPTGRWGHNMNSLGHCVYDCDKCRNISETCRIYDHCCFTGCKEGLKEEIEKFKEEYQVPSDILDFPTLT